MSQAPMETGRGLNITDANQAGVSSGKQPMATDQATGHNYGTSAPMNARPVGPVYNDGSQMQSYNVAPNAFASSQRTPAAGNHNMNNGNHGTQLESYPYQVPTGAPMGAAPGYNGTSGMYPQGYMSDATIANHHPTAATGDAAYGANRGPKGRFNAVPMENARWKRGGIFNRFFEWFHMLRVRYRDYLAEFFGTAVLVFLGESVVATAIMFSPAGSSASWILICFGWGFALTFALFMAGGVSGGHLNPAVTTTAAILRGFPWRKVPGYIASQMLGGFVGAGFVFALFHSSIHHFDGGNRQTVGPTATAGIFATYPQPWITVGTAVISEAFATAVLLFCIYGVTDERNMPGTAYAPLAIGFVITMIGLCVGFQTNFALNPARDVAPRAFSSAVGYGGTPWSAYDHYAWVPGVVPFFGALIGGFLYDFFVNHPRLDQDEYVSQSYADEDAANRRDAEV
ncbi:glycerol channel [Tieghemiomyces parasiticus]|uniref:Glycerol channel n=1 Tax=Tieghemiomyces parasiticus TaxID=78921 RepID=A0A9W8DZD9_9FUNG|nr:glycerol channel [Tieghemiomyces parasiticus]